MAKIAPVEGFVIANQERIFYTPTRQVLEVFQV